MSNILSQEVAILQVDQEAVTPQVDQEAVTPQVDQEAATPQVEAAVALVLVSVQFKTNDYMNINRNCCAGHSSGGSGGGYGHSG